MSKDDVQTAADLIRRIVQECPDRLAGTDSERRAQEILLAELDSRGAKSRLQPFEFNTHLYATLALHFGLAVVGTLLVTMTSTLAVIGAFAAHAAAGVSYALDSGRRYMLLRRLFPFRKSQNLIAVFPATDDLRLRVVIIAHADAAYTGVVFNPTVIRHATRPPPIKALAFMRKGLRVATVSVLLLAALDLAILAGAPIPMALMWGLTIPALLAFVLNLEVVLRNTLVPGANDNLTGCAATVILADRLKDKPADIELVLVCSGAEEAGCGGAWRLAQQQLESWSTDCTVVIGIDGLSNGKLRWMEDGEVLPLPPPKRLVKVIERTAAANPRFAEVERFEIPTGATDCSPFLARGYTAVCIGCIDPYIGAPLHYHRPSDTPDNLDLDQLGLSFDFVEALVREVFAEYAPRPGG